VRISGIFSPGIKISTRTYAPSQQQQQAPRTHGPSSHVYVAELGAAAISALDEKEKGTPPPTGPAGIVVHSSPPNLRRISSDSRNGSGSSIELRGPELTAYSPTSAGRPAVARLRSTSDSRVWLERSWSSPAHGAPPLPPTAAARQRSVRPNSITIPFQIGPVNLGAAIASFTHNTLPKEPRSAGAVLPSNNTAAAARAAADAASASGSRAEPSSSTNSRSRPQSCTPRQFMIVVSPVQRGTATDPSPMPRTLLRPETLPPSFALHTQAEAAGDNNASKVREMRSPQSSEASVAHPRPRQRRGSASGSSGGQHRRVSSAPNIPTAAALAAIAGAESCGHAAACDGEGDGHVFHSPPSSSRSDVRRFSSAGEAPVHEVPFSHEPYSAALPARECAAGRRSHLSGDLTTEPPLSSGSAPLRHSKSFDKLHSLSRGNRAYRL
jgi:hypothetical protein